MDVIKKYFTKECLKKTARTFIQAACGYFVTSLSMQCAGLDFTDGDAVLNVIVGLSISAVSAGVAAVMNLKAE